MELSFAQFIFCIIVIMIGFFAGLIISITLFDYIKRRSKRNKKETIMEKRKTKYDIMLTENLFDKVNGLLDGFILSAISIYYALEGITEEHYMSVSDIAEMQGYVTASVNQNITPAVKDLLGLVYDVDKLDSVIKLRIKLKMTDVIVAHNRTIEE